MPLALMHVVCQNFWTVVQVPEKVGVEPVKVPETPTDSTPMRSFLRS